MGPEGKNIFFMLGAGHRETSLPGGWERVGGANKQPAGKLFMPQFKGPLGPHADPAQQALEKC